MSLLNMLKNSRADSYGTVMQRVILELLCIVKLDLSDVSVGAIMFFQKMPRIFLADIDMTSLIQNCRVSEVRKKYLQSLNSE